jgi:hypothetical protein
MKQCILLFGALCLFLTSAMAQNNVGIGTTTPSASAALDVQSTTQGMLVPRMTKAQRDLVATPATGLLIYQTDNTPGFYFYNGAWTSLNDNLGNHTATQNLAMGNNSITGANTITTTKLNTSEISIGATNTSISLIALSATSSEIDATGKSFISLNSSSGSFHTIHGIAGGYDGKILYLDMSLGFTWVNNSTVEPISSNRLNGLLISAFTQSTTTGRHLIKLLYMSNFLTGRWVVIDSDI